MICYPYHGFVFALLVIFVLILVWFGWLRFGVWSRLARVVYVVSSLVLIMLITLLLFAYGYTGCGWVTQPEPFLEYQYSYGAQNMSQATDMLVDFLDQHYYPKFYNLDEERNLRSLQIARESIELRDGVYFTKDSSGTFFYLYPNGSVFIQMYWD